MFKSFMNSFVKINNTLVGVYMCITIADLYGFSRSHKNMPLYVTDTVVILPVTVWQDMNKNPDNYTDGIISTFEYDGSIKKRFTTQDIVEELKWFQRKDGRKFINRYRKVKLYIIINDFTYPVKRILLRKINGKDICLLELNK